jgi:hypothetical protein
VKFLWQGGITIKSTPHDPTGHSPSPENPREDIFPSLVRSCVTLARGTILCNQHPSAKTRRKESHFVWERAARESNARHVRAVTPDPENRLFILCLPSVVYQPDSLGASAHSVVVVAAAAPVSQLAGWASLHSPPVAAGKPAGAASQSPAPWAKPDSMAATPSSSTPGSFSSSTFSSASASGSRSAENR